MMEPIPKKGNPGTLEKAQYELKKWRESRENPRSRIPEKLMKMAAGLAENYGVAQTAQALNINYTRLKKYLAQAGQGQIKKAPEAQSFMQLNLSPNFKAKTLLFEIETVNPFGKKISLRFYQEPSPAILKTILSTDD
jgi:hypothetical protein